MKFGELIEVINNHVKFDNYELTTPEQLHPAYIFISDSIVVSAPLRNNNNGTTYSGLITVTVKVAQISLKLLEMGFLIRGGISVGNVCHSDGNIFGTGYIDAFKAEQQSCHPRIVYDVKAASLISGTSELHFGYPLNSYHVWIEYEGQWVADTLHPIYVDDSYYPGKRIDEITAPVFEKCKSNINSALKACPLGSPPRGKWEWMAGFFNAALRRHSINSVSPFIDIPLPD